MKKSLLLLASAFISLCASAQWTKPEIKTSDMVVGEECYLYNAEAGAFLRGLGSGAPDWGTRAGVSTDAPELVKINPAIVESLADPNTAGETCKWLDVDDKETYLIQIFPASKKRWDEIWFGVTDFSTVWVDRQNNIAANPNCFYNIKKNANGSYAISISSNSTIFVDEDYAADFVDAETGLSTIVLKGGEKLGINLADFRTYIEGYDAELSYDWYFVSKEDFDSFDFEALDTYALAMKLKAKLDDAKKEYPTVDFSASEAIYNNNKSTDEELNNAISLIDQAILEYNSNEATVDNPKDMSNAIINSTFDKIGDFTGWNAKGSSSFGAGGTTSTCAERYDMDFNTFQDIDNIPNGIYKVEVTGFYRAGSLANDWDTKDDPQQRNAKLYAVSGTDSLYNSLPSVSSWATEGSKVGGLEVRTTGDGAGYFAPNSMAEFTAYKEAGYANKTSVLVAVEDNHLRIGVAKNTHLATDWTIVDDFTLTFYGNSVEAYKMMFDDVKATINEDFSQIVEDETHYYKPARQEYIKCLEDAEKATTKEEIKRYTSQITSIAAKVLESIPAYDRLVAEVDKINEELANTSLNGIIVTFADLMNAEEDDAEAGKEAAESLAEDGVPAEYLEGIEYSPAYILNLTDGCFYTAEEVDAYIGKLQALYTYCVANSLTPGDDCTTMLVNPSFADGFTGWTWGKNSNGVAGGLKEFPIVESYQDHGKCVDIYQIVENVPEGIYSLSCQAFERPAANGSFTGDEEPKVFLYMNDFQTPVMNICKDAMPEDKAEDKVNCYITEQTGAWPYDYNQSGYGWIPNSVDGGSYAFMSGRYTQKVYGIVDNGTMKIGLTSNGVQHHWVLWANFKLTYEGITEEAVDAIAEKYVNDANDYLEAHSGDMTEPAQVALAEAIEKVENADDTQDKYNAILELNKALPAARENVAAREANEAARSDMDSAFEEYAETASKEAVEAYYELEDIAIDELTTEGLKELTAKYETVAGWLKVPNAEDASDKNPIDMTQVIVNPDFEANVKGQQATGWTLVKGETASGNYQVQTGFEGVSMEFWSPTTGEGTQFDFYQRLTKLPAGTYTITADIADSYNGQNPGTGEGFVYLYAAGANGESLRYVSSDPVQPQTESCNEADKKWNNYSVTITLKEGEDLVIGTKNVGVLSARWVMIDNFKIEYYGTESSKEDSEPGPVVIEGVETIAATPVSIFTVSGARVNALQRGINIVKMSDNTIRKIFVK